MLLVQSIRFNLVTAEFFKQEISGHQAYPLVYTQIDQQIEKLQIDPQYPITQAEIKNLVHGVFTETWLRRNVEGSLDTFFTWLNGPSRKPLTIPIDVRQPKRQVITRVDALLAEKLPQLQPCPDKKRPPAEQGLCQFAGKSVAQVKEDLKHAGVDVASIPTLLPDTFDLVNPDVSMITGQKNSTDQNSAEGKARQIKDRLSQAKAEYQRAIFLLNLSLIIYGLLIALYLAINFRRGWLGLTRWSGVLLVTLAILPLAVSVASDPILEQQLIPRIHFNPNTPVELKTLAPELVRDIRSAVFTPVLIMSLAAFTLGLSGIIGAHWIQTPTPVKRKS